MQSIFAPGLIDGYFRSAPCSRLITLTSVATLNFIKENNHYIRLDGHTVLYVVTLYTQIFYNEYKQSNILLFTRVSNYNSALQNLIMLPSNKTSVAAAAAAAAEQVGVPTYGIFFLIYQENNYKCAAKRPHKYCYCSLGSSMTGIEGHKNICTAFGHTFIFFY